MPRTIPHDAASGAPRLRRPRAHLTRICRSGDVGLLPAPHGDPSLIGKDGTDGLLPLLAVGLGLDDALQQVDPERDAGRPLGSLRRQRPPSRLERLLPLALVLQTERQLTVPVVVGGVGGDGGPGPGDHAVRVHEPTAALGDAQEGLAEQIAMVRPGRLEEGVAGLHRRVHGIEVCRLGEMPPARGRSGVGRYLVRPPQAAVEGVGAGVVGLQGLHFGLAREAVQIVFNIDGRGIVGRAQCSQSICRSDGTPLFLRGVDCSRRGVRSRLRRRLGRCVPLLLALALLLRRGLLLVWRHIGRCGAM
mmetsp:Transcript_30451/g.71334  ORF Transcript_30451/g.71334 Transcript_30451/m.71334 type:complete len:304 (+) Transcript_30451:818-1729(+)